MNNLVDESGVM